MWGDAAVAVRAGVAELATFVCSSSSDMSYSGARIVWGDAAVAIRAGVAELATFVCSSSSDMTCSDYASVIALRCQVS